MKLLKSTYAQAHHRDISIQMLPPLCGRNPLSSENQMSSWVFFFSVSLFSAMKVLLVGSL